MKEYIDKLKQIDTLVELSIGTTMTEAKAIDIYAVTNNLMCKMKKLSIEKDKRIEELEEAALELFNLVHESDLIQNKITANELYDIIKPQNK